MERIRRNLAQLERFRLLFVGFYVVAAVAYVWSLVLFCRLLAVVVQPALPNFFGFGIGMIVGLVFGLLNFKLASALYLTFGCRRNERLLVRYFDTIRAMLSAADDAADVKEPQSTGPSTPGAERG